jgi:hypothetical protein
MNAWVRGLVSSVAISLPAAWLVAFMPHTTMVSPGVPWDRLQAMPYGQAVKLIQSHTHNVPAWTFLAGNLRDPFIWRNFCVVWALLSVVCFLSCCALLLWQRRVAI